MNENTRYAFASYGLEIFKRSVLLVLYEEHLGERRRLTRIEISQRFGIKKPGGRDIDNRPLIEGILGSAVSLAQTGATVVDMRVAGRWKSSQIPAHYAKAELAERGAIA